MRSPDISDSRVNDERSKIFTKLVSYVVNFICMVYGYMGNMVNGYGHFAYYRWKTSCCYSLRLIPVIEMWEWYILYCILHWILYYILYC